MQQLTVGKWRQRKAGYYRGCYDWSCAGHQL